MDEKGPTTSTTSNSAKVGSNQAAEGTTPRPPNQPANQPANQWVNQPTNELSETKLPSTSAVKEGFAAIRREFGVAGPMPPDVEAAAKAAVPIAMGRRDATDLLMVTLDPASSTDLDQAFAFSREPGESGPSGGMELSECNIVLHYAIADIGAFAPLGGVIEAEAWKRGTTVYAPDGSTPVYPRVLCQDRASLLPDGPRPCILLEVVVAPDGTARLRNIERATVQSRAKLAYETTTKADLVPEAVELARRVTEAEDRRGAFRVDFDVQEVVIDPEAPMGVTLRFAPRAESEDLNACISLAANMAVATAMIEGGVGLFRVMDDPDSAELGSLRRMAKTLGVPWARDESLRLVIPRLDATNPKHIAFSISARRSGGGASYAVFSKPNTPMVGATPFGEATAPHEGKPWHSAMAASYAHATAPMRRLADRYVLELLLAKFSGDDAAEAVLLPKLVALPAIMAEADQRAAKVDRACLDFAECMILSARVGETFNATIIEVSRDIAQFTIDDPCIVARVRVPKPQPGHPEVSPGDDLTLRLDAVDVVARRLSFSVCNG